MTDFLDACFSDMVADAASAADLLEAPIFWELAPATISSLTD